ncbi:MAG TPA: hypothetical protein VHT52_21805 [Stellaceae bacterium]|nr:hypothetical protein [Stellaceae bacterium]
MNETSFAASEIASRQRGITVDERELWETLRLDAGRAAAGEEMLRGFLELAVLRHNTFASGFGLLLARKLAEDSMAAERLGGIARVAMASDPTIIAEAIADLPIASLGPAENNAGIRLFTFDHEELVGRGFGPPTSPLRLASCRTLA